MIPLKTFVSERRAANLLTQIRCCDGVYCPHCRTESPIRHGSYRVFQRYLCKDCSRTFNDKTGTVFEYSAIPLRKWYLAVYTYIRLNTSIRQLDAELAVSYKTVYRPQLEGPVEIDELYVNAGKKGRERDGWSRSRGLSTRGRGTYHEDKPPVFILADRGTGETYVHPAKAADESTIRFLLADRKEESLTEVSLKTSSHPISERYSFENVSGENPVTKRSKPSSKLRYDATNNPLPMSVGIVSYRRPLPRPGPLAHSAGYPRHRPRAGKPTQSVGLGTAVLSYCHMERTLF